MQYPAEIGADVDHDDYISEPARAAAVIEWPDDFVVEAGDSCGIGHRGILDIFKWDKHGNGDISGYAVNALDGICIIEVNMFSRFG
jgi:hypothetical protein